MSDKIKPQFVCGGYVRDAGGGVITIVVDRDTESYPPSGLHVRITGDEPQDESCPATRDARGIAPIPCALPLGHPGEHRSKGGTTWAGIVPQFVSCPDCDGRGIRWDDMGCRCVTCEGTGRVEPQDDSRSVVDRAAREVALAFESWGQAWWTDDSGDVLALVAAEALATAGMLGPVNAQHGTEPQNDLQCSHGVPWSQCPDREAHHEHPRPGTEPQFDSPDETMAAIQAAVTDNERAALRDAAARQWCLSNPGWGTHRCLSPKDHDGAHRCAYCRETW